MPVVALLHDSQDVAGLREEDLVHEVDVAQVVDVRLLAAAVVVDRPDRLPAVVKGHALEAARVNSHCRNDIEFVVLNLNGFLQT